MTNEPYNPLDKRHLGESVTAALLKRPVVPLPPPASFNGAGIYALYFHGDLPACYAKIAAKNMNDQWAAPIYVGKAVPPGASKGAYGLDASPGEALYRRLREHAESVLQAENLSLEDFKCRYLVVDDIWIPLGESLLISMFSPLWNRGIHLSRDTWVVSVGCVLRTNACGVLLDRPRCVGRTLQICPALSR